MPRQRKPPRQLGLFDKPERIRDYAKERAQRDAKAIREGHKSYNAKAYKQAVHKATVVEHYPTLAAKKVHQAKVRNFTDRFLDKVREVGFDFEQWIEDEDFDETFYWELFRDSYGKKGVAA